MQSLSQTLRAVILMAVLGATRQLAAQTGTIALDSLSEWQTALARFRDADPSAAQAGLEEVSARHLSRLSSGDQSRVYTFQAILAKDAGNDALARTLLARAWSISIEPWRDSAEFSPRRRDFVLNSRAESLIPDLVSIEDVVAGSVIKATGRGQQVSDFLVVLIDSLGNRQLLPERTTEGEWSSLPAGAYDLEVSTRLPVVGAYSAPAHQRVRLVRHEPDVTLLGPVPSPPIIEDASRTVWRRSGGMKALGWLLGGLAMGTGAGLGSKCDRQWDPDGEVFKSYGASCGGWALTAGGGLLFLIASHTFLNPRRARAVHDERIAASNRDRQADFERAATAYGARRAQLRPIIRLVAVGAETP